MGAQINPAINIDLDLDRIDTAIAVSLGWQLTSFVDEDRIQKDNYRTLLEPSFSLVTDGENFRIVADSKINLDSDFLLLTEQKTYYEAPEGEFDCDTVWRWLEKNRGVPQFTRNQQDLEILLGAIDREVLALKIKRTNGKNICVLEGSSNSVQLDYCGSLNTAICLVWLKFYNIEL